MLRRDRVWEIDVWNAFNDANPDALQIAVMVSARKLIALSRVPAAAIGVLALFGLTHAPHGPEHWSADLLTAYLSPAAKSQDRRIALVKISEDSLQGYLSPIDRDFLGRLIGRIDSAGPRAIGIDLIFDRPTETEKDGALIDTIRDAKAPVVISALYVDSLAPGQRSFQQMVLDKTGRPAGHPYFHSHAGKLTVSDDVVRSLPETSGRDAVRKSFAEALVSAAGISPAVHPGPIAWLLPPSDGNQTFWEIPAESLMAADETARLLISDLHNRFVIIGGNFSDRDRHLTPLSLRNGARMSGLDIHAQVVAQILDRRSVPAVGVVCQVLLLLGFMIAGYWIAGRSRWRHAHLGTELLSVLAILVIGVAAFKIFNLVFPFGTILLGWLIGAAIGRGTPAKSEAATSHSGERS
jgi:adenylate cyclase